MSEIQKNFAANYLRLWTEEQSEFFLDNEIVNLYSSEKPGFGNLRVELPKYLIDVCVWDNANSLDIQIIHLPSENVTFPTTGECASEKVFKEKLDELNVFMTNNYE